MMAGEALVKVLVSRTCVSRCSNKRDTELKRLLLSGFIVKLVI